MYTINMDKINGGKKWLKLFYVPKLQVTVKLQNSTSTEKWRKVEISEIEVTHPLQLLFSSKFIRHTSLDQFRQTVVKL